MYIFLCKRILIIGIIAILEQIQPQDKETESLAQEAPMGLFKEQLDKERQKSQSISQW